jgi:hypothetical protein
MASSRWAWMAMALGAGLSMAGGAAVAPDSQAFDFQEWCISG